MPYNQDRKYSHFAEKETKGKNIPETRAKDMGGMQGTEKPKLEMKEHGADAQPWESKTDGFEYGTHMSGEEARKPHSGDKEPGKKRK